jgi:iron complex transport system permease protein
VAALSGIGLSLSGLLYQEIFQNKLTSPDLLGVSSGAALGTAIAITLGLSSIFVSVFAFLLGIETVLITILISKLFKNGSSITLILAGIIVGGFMSAALSLVKYFADPTTTLASITYWLMGSFENSTMKIVYVMLPIVVVSCVVLLVLSWRINIVALGQEEAQTKGVNYVFYRTLIILIATLLTASSVAFAGTISWIGLVIPHIVRLCVGRDTTKTIPLSITFGASFMIISDILCRSFTAAEIPISAITGFFGTIVFIAIMYARRNTLHEND